MAETTTPKYTIRYATEHDIPQILLMIRELADYERALDEVQATESKLYETLSFPTSSDEQIRSKPGVAKCLLVLPVSGDTNTTKTTNEVEVEIEVAGMALFFNNYSTWLARPGIYLEDLFVRSAHRKKGYGLALLQALARECVANDWGRLEWSVLSWNEPSIRFYESGAVGARSLRGEWEGMRVDGERLVKLAGDEV